MKHTFYFDREYLCWIHRPKLKLIINPILRKLQFFTKRPFVIDSIVAFDDNGAPEFIKYGFHRHEKLGEFVKERCDVYVDGKKIN